MESDDECICNECQLYIRAIRKMGKIFTSIVCQDSNAMRSDNNNAKKYAITINISPFKLMNKKRWFTYSHDKQRAQLSRIESKFRELTPSIKLIKLVYEVAPAVNNCEKFRNIHIHALYECPEEFKSEMETYYNRICKDPTNNWNHLKIDDIYDEAGWYNYITKDMVEVDINKLK